MQIIFQDRLKMFHMYPIIIHLDMTFYKGRKHDHITWHVIDFT